MCTANAAVSSSVRQHFVPVIVRSKDQVLTEVFGIPANPDTGAPLLQVLVVPGNPGNAGYYRSFMRLLHGVLGGRAHVLSCSHAGHDVHHTNTGKQLWDLEDQIQHKIDFMRQHLLLPGRPPLVILAHSIGAYMAVHAVHRLESLSHTTSTHTPPNAGRPHVPSPLTPAPHVSLAVDAGSNERSRINPSSTAGLLGHPDESYGQQPLFNILAHVPPHAPHAALLHGPDSIPRVHKVVALMPFFRADLANQWRQRALAFMARRYWIMSALAAALQALPVIVRTALIRWWTLGSLNHEAVQTTAELLNPASIKNNFYLANSEFHILARPFQWELLARLGERLHVLACPRDVWMSQGQYKEMMACVPALQRECKEVTRIVNEILKPYLKLAQAHAGPLIGLSVSKCKSALQGTGHEANSEKGSNERVAPLSKI